MTHSAGIGPSTPTPPVPPPSSAHLEAQCPTAVRIEGVEQEVSVGTGIWGGEVDGGGVRERPMGSVCFWGGVLGWVMLSGGVMYPQLTSLREELRVDEREGLLVHVAAGTVLEGGQSDGHGKPRSGGVPKSREGVPTHCAHVLEAAVEGLQLLLGELGVCLQLLQRLGLVPRSRELHVGIAAVCWG